MSFGFCLLLLSASNAFAQSSKPVVVTFKKRRPKVGDKKKRRSFTKVVMKSLDYGGGQLQPEGEETESIYFQNKETVTRMTEILARNDKHVTKIRVRCIKHNKTSVNETAKTERSPIAGKTMILDKKKKKTVVTDTKGKVVSAELKKLAISKYSGDFYDFEESFYKTLKNGQATIGEAIEVDAKLANELFRDDDNDGPSFKVTAMTMTLKALEKDGLGRFEMIVVFERGKVDTEERKQDLTRLTLKGYVTVHVASCALKVIDLNGPVRFISDDGTLNRGALGTVGFKEEVTHTFVKPVPKK